MFGPWRSSAEAPLTTSAPAEAGGGPEPFTCGELALAKEH